MCLAFQIGSNINNKNLSEEEFFPIFEAAENLGMAIMIHPWNMMGFSSMEKYWLMRVGGHAGRNKQSNLFFNIFRGTRKTS
ncbi:MAG: hypothetical protein R2772_03530 [Chitinophagales bacterium]